MAVSYNNLWKLMIDKNINKTKLRRELVRVLIEALI